MNIEDLLDRLLGFMPQRSVIWAAIGTFLFSITIQYVNQWVNDLTKLPWMKEENQRNRQQILQGTVKLPEKDK